MLRLPGCQWEVKVQLGIRGSKKYHVILVVTIASLDRGAFQGMYVYIYIYLHAKLDTPNEKSGLPKSFQTIHGLIQEEETMLCFLCIIHPINLRATENPTKCAAKTRNTSMHTGVIILPAQTMHYYKGNSPKLPYLARFACV